MAFFPMAPGHRIQLFVQPCTGNSPPPSPTPGRCLRSSCWSWGTEQRQQLLRKGEEHRDQPVTMGGGESYPAKAANQAPKSFLQPLRQAGHEIRDLLQSRCILEDELPRP